MPISIDDIYKAREVIQSHIQRTQLGHSRSGSEWLGTETHFKFENEQTTGSFKIRGAMNKICSLSKEELAKGIVASSAGNHAQGVAYSASRAGAKAHIVMPTPSPIVKVMATQSYGANVILHGQIYDDAYAHARHLEKEKGYTFVHPFEDAKVIAGQGTVGLEILESLADVDSVIVPIGGGGLISGIATAVKALRPQCKVYGAVPENNPGMFRKFKHVEGDSNVRKPTIADGLAVKTPSPGMYGDYISRLVDDVTTVTEDEIAEAIVFLLERAKTVVEGSGAVGLAAAAKMKKTWDLGRKTCIVLCGGNIDLNAVSKVIERGLSKKGRLARMAVTVQDRPGTLHRLTNVLAEKRANILQVNHDRLKPQLEMYETSIEFLVETRGEDHLREVQEALTAAGARIDGVDSQD